MHSNKSILIPILLLFYSLSALGEITYAPVTASPSSIWEADSMFLGADIIAKDSSSDITVKWKHSKGDTVASLYFMVPGNPDSSVFLFHNHIWNYPSDDSLIHLGQYPAGTPLVFKYVIPSRDGTQRVFYTGQNRNDTDPYISSQSGAMGKRWAVAGKKDSATVEVGFEWAAGYVFKHIVFDVKGAKLQP